MTNHRNKWIKFITAFVLAFCFMAYLRIPVTASNGIAAEIKVAQDFEVKRGKQPSAGAEFKYQLTSLNEDYPMPEDTNENSVYRFELDGKEKVNIQVDFVHAGFYQYQIEPVIEKEQTGYTYDKSVYIVNVHVKNSENGLTTAIVITDADQNKIDEIVYNHSYESEEGLLVKTGDSARPMLYMVICCASMILVVFVVKVKQKESLACEEAFEEEELDI